MLHDRGLCVILAIGAALIAGILIGHVVTAEVGAGAAELAAEIIR